ncbi:tetratricopeptide repeat protein [Myxococcota bacterium]|nr:tetratricopeptide repeat protein [Myxococcota bacterium]
MTMRFAKFGLLFVVAFAVACAGPAAERKADQVVQGEEAKAAPAAKKGPDLTMREVVAPAEPEYVEGVDKGAQDAFRTGVVAISQTPPDYATGIKSFEKAIQLDKGFLEAYFNLGMCYERTGRPLQAVEVYQNAADANPGNLDAEGYVGKVYLALAKRERDAGDTNKAVEYEQKAKALFDKIIADNPDNTTANNSMALYWLYRGNSKLAEDFVQKVLMLEPHNVVALNTRGLINLMAGQLNIARWVFEEKVLREDPNSTEAWSNLGITYVKMGKMPEAVASFEKAVESDADNFEARMNVAAIYLNFLHYQAALEQYDVALKLVPDCEEALIGSGSALFGMLQFEKAIERWQKVLTLNPDRSEMYARIGQLYESKLNNLEKAIEYYEMYIAKAHPPANDPIVAKLPMLKQMHEQGDLFLTPMDEEAPEGAAPAEDGAAPAPAPAAQEPVSEPAAEPAAEPVAEPAASPEAE